MEDYTEVGGSPVDRIPTGALLVKRTWCSQIKSPPKQEDLIIARDSGGCFETTRIQSEKMAIVRAMATVT